MARIGAHLRASIGAAFKRHRDALTPIEESGAARHKVDIAYTKKNGEHIDRICNPYEIKPHRTSGAMMVYLTDDASGPRQIKSYRADRVQSAEPTAQRFLPRWPVQF